MNSETHSFASGVSRRRLLSAVGIGAGVAIAGCLGDDEDEEPEEVTVTVALENRDDVERRFDVQVIRGDVTVSRFEGPLQGGSTTIMRSMGQAHGEEHRVSIDTENAGQSYSWEPIECAELDVDGWIENGEPDFETECQSDS